MTISIGVLLWLITLLSYSILAIAGISKLKYLPQNSFIRILWLLIIVFIPFLGAIAIIGIYKKQTAFNN
ncbi:PLDc N-terminal domain-containing protein [Ornithobacterium rhinotracheale]|uniref:PLDc N-terminal domain-containing protein n=1 Tax=Ornithobacterium rhinotracheale TaxID=28251 RepID=UPI003FA47BA0